MDVNTGADSLRDRAKMCVMGQVDDLANARHLCEDAKGFLRAQIVEGLHDVVGDEGNRLPGSREFMIARDP